MFNNILLKLRKSKNVTQTELAKAIGVSSGNVSDWEKGRSKPGYEALQNISRYFGIGADILLDLQTPIQDDNYLTADETILLKKYKALSSDDKEEISMLLDIKYNRAFSKNGTNQLTYSNGKNRTGGNSGIA